MTKISSKMLKWYDIHRRELPWRAQSFHTANPYHVWLSEIMLQQTTVSAVKAYFNKFVKTWPTVESLARAQEEDILSAWAGLGYYARARNLIKCAKIITYERNGIFPQKEDELKKLPGIGDYTSAAIASIAFGKSAVVVDSNIERIVSRLNQIKDPLPASKKPIKFATKGITPKHRAGDFAQAMMDLGASLCSPKTPKCCECPLKDNCLAFKTGDMENYPVKVPKKAKPTRRALAYIIEVDGHILLERRPEKGLLGGMPGLLSTEWLEQDAIIAFNHEAFTKPYEAKWQLVDGISKHSFTHFNLETMVLKSKLDKRPKSNHIWVNRDEIMTFGLPTVFKKIVKLAL